MCIGTIMPSCKSFMNKTKSMDPKMDPWGTPDRTGFTEDLTPSNTTLCSRSQSYFFKNFSSLPSIEYEFFNLSRIKS